MKANNPPFFSIVIAAYNAELYIDEAMESCIEQTCRNIEIIVVDDGSNDATRAIVEKYASLDNRVALICQPENRGTLQARRVGVEHASGLYCVFLDSDDILDRRTCEILQRYAEIERCDVLQFDADLLTEVAISKEREDGYLSFNRPYSEKMSDVSLVSACFTERLFGWNVWGKAWTTSVCKRAYENIPELNLSFAEDMLFSFFALECSRSYCGIEQKLYTYRIGSGITTQKEPMSLQKFVVVLRALNIDGAIREHIAKAELPSEYCRAADYIADHVMDDVFDALAKVAPEDLRSAISMLLEYRPNSELSYELALRNAKRSGRIDELLVGKEWLEGQYVSLNREIDRLNGVVAKLESRVSELKSEKKQIKERYEKKLQVAQEKAADAQKKVEEYSSSNSWRIGRAVTSVPRAIKRATRTK